MSEQEKPNEQTAEVIEKEKHAEFVKEFHGKRITDGIVFKYTGLGEPLFIVDNHAYYSAIRAMVFTPEQLEAVAKFIRENPKCKLYSDGSGIKN